MLNLDENSEVEAEKSSSLIPTQGFFIDTVQNYSEIINKATLSEELENQFRLLFGVAEMQSGGNAEDAIDLLEHANTTDSSSILLKEMALAEAYMEKGDQEGAVKAYERVLETHPDYWFAVNNRAMIYYEKGEYEQTLEALNKKLQQEPENVTVLTLRGSVRLKTMQLREAEEDLEKAQQLSEEQKDIAPKDKQYIRKKIDLLEEKKATENKRVISAKNDLSNNPNDLNALTELAEANRNLGNYRIAKDFATRILQIDENNLKGISIKLESAEKTQDLREVTNLKREVLQLDTSRQRQIIEDRPIMRSLLKNIRIQ
jgi:tetratricopeptide (TPR) repeat protein